MVDEVVHCPVDLSGNFLLTLFILNQVLADFHQCQIQVPFMAVDHLGIPSRIIGMVGLIVTDQPARQLGKSFNQMARQGFIVVPKKTKIPGTVNSIDLRCKTVHRQDDRMMVAGGQVTSTSKTAMS